MQTPFLSRLALKTALGLAGLACSSLTLAAPLGLYGGPTIDKTSPACLTFGDAISCSAGMLNVFAGLAPTQQTTGGGYVYASPQGALKNAIVLQTGGNAATGNGDTDPSPGAVEDGYMSNSQGAAYTATGQTGNTVGSLGDPANNGLQAGADAKGTWDVEIAWLIQALTVDSLRRELMIGFDYNQPQNGSGSLSFWGLITVRDLQQTQSDISFEIKNTGFDTDPYTFTSDKHFDSKPHGTDFGTVVTLTCYKKDSGVVIDVQEVVVGSCAAGYETVYNAKSDSTTEMFAFLPELNASLENYLAMGYDVISTRLLLGCFGGTDPKAGQGYLSGGSTTFCDGGGNADIYLLAGSPMSRQLPEPGTLALAAVALGPLGWAMRRRRAARP